MKMTKEEIKAALEREKKERLRLEKRKDKRFVIHGYHIVAGVFILLLAYIVFTFMYEPKPTKPTIFTEEDNRRYWDTVKKRQEDFFEMDSKKGYVDRMLEQNK